MIDVALGRGAFMFGYVLSELRRRLRGLFDTPMRLLAGAAFMTLAMAAIEYDEYIAPGVSRLSDAWTMAATDFSRKLAGFTL
jgi:hypothetical protein